MVKKRAVEAKITTEGAKEKKPRKKYDAAKLYIAMELDEAHDMDLGDGIEVSRGFAFLDTGETPFTTTRDAEAWIKDHGVLDTTYHIIRLYGKSYTPRAARRVMTTA